jgi:hypothetical protein
MNEIFVLKMSNENNIENNHNFCKQVLNKPISWKKHCNIITKQIKPKSVKIKTKINFINDDIENYTRLYNDKNQVDSQYYSAHDINIETIVKPEIFNYKKMDSIG